MALAVAACFAQGAAALPNAPTVAAGQASFAYQGKNLSVTNTPGTIINWGGFSIGRDELARFIQQSPSSAVLNRVVGQDPSLILGRLQSNGRVFLINPSGIVFGAGAQIDVAGLTASSLNIKDADFIAGRLRFAGRGGEGEVINHGEIRTPQGGRVFLIAPRVENQGVIHTPSGEIVLAAGRSVELADDANSGVRVEVTAPADRALNVGSLVASGGSVRMYGSVVRNSGRINADAAVVEDGRVFLRSSVAQATPEESRAMTAGSVRLRASSELSIEAGSRISADGPIAGTVELASGGDIALKPAAALSANGVAGGAVLVQAAGTVYSEGVVEAQGSDGGGGRVRLLGERVAILGGRVDASGARGGGEVLVGGDYQGANAAVQNAERALVSAGAELRADALAEGDGGKVVVWADGDTRYSGSISARGAGAGAGGFVEVSGKQQLDFHGAVDVGAESGKGGRVLLDPQDIVLNATAQPAPPNNPNGTPDLAFADAPVAGTTTIQVADVIGYSQLYLQATNNITLNSALAMTAGNSVLFQAGNAIAINAALTASGGVSLSGASITSTAAGTISANGAGNQNAGNVSLNASGLINLAGAVSASGGGIL